MLSRTQRFLILFASLPLAATSALAQTAPPAQSPSPAAADAQPEIEDLDMASARRLIRGFEARVTEEGVAQLVGYVPRACAHQFVVNNTVTDEGIRSGSEVGYRIIYRRNPGEKDCMGQHRRERCTRHNCVSLSDADLYPDATLRFADIGDEGRNLTVGLLLDRPGVIEFEKFEPSIVFEAERSKRERREAERRADEAEIARREAAYRVALVEAANCTPESDADVRTVRNALREVCGLTDSNGQPLVSPEDCKERSRELDEQRFEIREKMAEELLQPDEDGKVPERNYRRARRLLEDALEDSRTIEDGDTRRQWRTRIQNSLAANQMSYLSHQAQGGWENNQSFQNQWNSLYVSSWNRWFSSCSQYYQNASVQSCSTAQKALDQTYKLQEQALTADFQAQQQIVMQQQAQQMMYIRMQEYQTQMMTRMLTARSGATMAAGPFSGTAAAGTIATATAAAGTQPGLPLSSGALPQIGIAPVSSSGPFVQ